MCGEFCAIKLGKKEEGVYEDHGIRHLAGN